MSLTQYLLEFSICLALLYGLYHFLLRKETFFQLNRWYLLLSPVAAMVIPFLNWQLPTQPTAGAWESLNQIIYPLVTEMQHPQTVFWQTMETPPVPSWNITFLDLLLLCYLLGVVWMGYRLLYRTWKLMELIGLGKQEKHAGYTTVSSEHKIPAASFLSYIFWQEGPMSPERKYILEHELVHVRQWHSLDVLLMEIWVMLKWFHPMIYWYRNSLRLTHEYIADAYVSRAGGSKLEYARLLAGAQSSTIANPLLHHFDSSIKMRLLMLAKKQSGYWKFFRFLGTVPVTAFLLLLFSFNLAEELPDPITDPLTKAGHALENMVQQPLITPVGLASPTPVPKNYSLKWGSIQCRCENQQFPNYYRCQDQSLQPAAFRRLIRREGGFELLLEDQPQVISELTAVSKYMKDMGGFKGQFDEMDQEFNLDSPLWKQAEKGDVFRFTFSNSKGDYFEFELVINNGKEEYVFGNVIEIGDQRFNLSQFSSHLNMKVAAGTDVITMDVEEFQQLARSPLRVRKNEDEYYKLAKAGIWNSNALRADAWSDLHQTDLDISDSKPVAEAFPGDRIYLQLFTEENQEIRVHIALRQRSAWDGRKRDFQIQWGDQQFELFQSVLLSKDQIRSFLNRDLYLLTKGKKYRVLNGETPKTVQLSLGHESWPFDYKAEIERQLQGQRAGGGPLFVGGLVTEGDYIMPGFALRIYVDQDWRQVFSDNPLVQVSEEGSRISIEGVTTEMLEQIFNLRGFIPHFYNYEIDDSENPTRTRNEPELREWLNKNAVGKKLVITKKECLSCS